MSTNTIARIDIAETDLIIRSPYNADFVAALKESVPPQARKWDGLNKAWTVSPEYGDVVAALMQQHYGVIVDGRQSADEIAAAQDAAEEAALNAEIATIRRHQALILANKDELEANQERLDGKVKGYSYTSKSRVKASAASDAALLRHALESATKPVENLVEVEIRGMAAVVRRWELVDHEEA